MIHKLTRSGKGMITITDEGLVFITSVVYMKSLLEGQLKASFCVPSRMPFTVDPDKFKKSELYVPEGMTPEYLAEQLEKQKDVTQTSDALSSKAMKERQQVKTYNDDEW